MQFLIDTHKGKYYIESDTFNNAIKQSELKDIDIISITSITEYNNCIANCVAKSLK